MGFASVEEIETRAKEQECQLWETILHDDITTGRPPRVYRENEQYVSCNERCQ